MEELKWQYGSKKLDKEWIHSPTHPTTNDTNSIRRMSTPHCTNGIIVKTLKIISILLYIPNIISVWEKGEN